MKSKPYILGVDPGQTGAFAVLDPTKGDLVAVGDMPYKKGLGIDCTKLGLLLGCYLDHVQFAIVEDVHAMPGQGVVSMFSFGVAKGIVLGVLGGALVPVILVKPAVWKNVFGLSKDKNKSRELACRKFPTWGKSFVLKKFDGRAEAALLADFGKRFW